VPPKPYYFQDGITIYHGDCREILPTLDPVDLVLTDPPYGIPAGAAFWRKNGSVIDDDGLAGHNLLVEGWRELVQLRTPAAFIEFMGSGFDAIDRTRQGHRDAGLEEVRLFLIVKPAPAPTVRPVMCTSWEPALISQRGGKAWHGGGYVPDSWIGLSPNRLGQGVHPTQKPIEPFHRLVQAFSPNDGAVLDPFMGSGTTLRAAKDLGRKAIGIEIEERYCEIAAKRLQQSVMVLT
jgi:site-specific DNA-methyltransferase (adenine-specific)